MNTYEKYKDSGVQWIGEIPSHWIVKRFKDCHYEVDNRVEERWSDFPLLSLSKKGVIPRDIDSGVGKFPGSFNDYKEIEPDDLIFCLYDIEETPRTIGLSDLHGMITGSYKVFRTNGVLPKYTYYVYLSIDDVKGLKPFYTGLRNVVRPETFKSLPFITPPLTEQHQIVSFLDEKTSLIDDLINKKEQKIGLLKEYRTSLINRVITKGLNPDCPMKDSGVEWIGEIPSHWDVKRLKFLFHIVKDISGELGYDVLSVTQRGLKKKDLTTNEGQMSMDYSKYQFVRPGQFVMNHMDLLTGYIDISQYDGVTSPDYRVFEVSGESVSPRYYLSIFQMCYHTRIFYGLGSGVSTSGRWRLPSDEFLNFSLPYPPLTEQEQIVSVLDEKTGEIDRTIQSEVNKIELLKEYRQSLISSVITGKIKVVN